MFSERGKEGAWRYLDRAIYMSNGQNGTVASDLPEKTNKSGGLREFLSDLLE